MRLEEVNRMFGIPMRALQRLRKERMIGNEIEEGDIKWFVLLGYVWGKKEYVADQIADWSTYRKKALIANKDQTPLEKRIISRFINLRPGEKITINQVAMELHTNCGVKITTSLFAQIRKARKSAYNKKAYLARSNTE